jgi:subtilisin family serine protease
MPGRYIVILKAGSDSASVARSHTRFGVHASLIYRSALRGYAGTIPSNKLAALRRDPRVASIRRDRVVRIAAQTTPTGVKRMGATKPGSGAGINVAVVDTGIDTSHPELAANIASGKNCTTRPNFQDENGHGTHVAGIIAAVNNSSGVRGVAPNAKLWPVRVLDQSGNGNESWVVCGLDFVDQNSPAKGGTIKIANLSLVADGGDDGNCGFTDGDAIHQAVCRLVADGVTVIAAAGNEGRDVKHVSPASFDEVITVSALADSDGVACGIGGGTWAGADDTFASFSNYASLASDKARMIGAPGVDIVSTVINNGYALMSGTSMAAPHVTGAAARYIASHPGASPAAVRTALRSGGEPVNVGGGCVGGLNVLHADPSGKHAEPVVLAPSLLSTWSRFPSGQDAAGGSPYTHGR